MSFVVRWPILQKEAIDKLIHNLELGHSCDKLFTFEEYMRFYTVVHDVALCYDEPQKLHDQYIKTFEDYISYKVLPSLRSNENENLLKEFLRRWSNHKIMTKWLSGFFQYLSSHYIPRMTLPSLVQSSNMAFYNRAYSEIKHQISRAIASLVDREREGEEIDQAMVKQVLDIVEEIKDIEEALVEAAARFYSKKALEWIATMSYQDYMQNVEECLEKEKRRVSKYLRIKNEKEILEVLQHELLEVHAAKLEEMKFCSRFQHSRL